MAKKTGNNPQKQQKKQARREAKAMLAIEQARTGVEKAEKKLAKAQLRLEARGARLRNLEAALNALRTPHTGESEPDSGYDHQQGQPEQPEEESATSTPETPSSNGAQQLPTEIPVNQLEAQPPAEGRADIFTSDSTGTESESSGEEQPAEVTEIAAATGDVSGASQAEDTAEKPAARRSPRRATRSRASQNNSGGDNE